jgi:Polyketide cyclase / dehydrase and lipid transport
VVVAADSVQLEIEADADTLYRMVSDLPRIGEWSPECERVTWEGETVTPVEGTTFVGHNAVGPGRRIRYRRHQELLEGMRTTLERLRASVEVRQGPSGLEPLPADH